jgi:alanine dehydrogenase
MTFPEFFSNPYLVPQEEMLAVHGRRQSLTIGVPKETMLNENRVPLSPDTVLFLVNNGLEVIMEKGAGKNANYTDVQYAEAGAKIVAEREEIFKCHIVVKIAPPTIEEINLLTQDQILISPLHLLLLNETYIDKLLEKRTTAYAMEYLQSHDGSFPLVKSMSEIAGSTVVLTAGELLKKQYGGRGVLLGGIAGVPPAKVVVIGAGIVGEYAARTSLSLGASVRLFDNDINKINRLQMNLGRQLHTSTLNPTYLLKQLKSADVVIGAIHSKHGRSPIVVSEDMISQMKEGAIVIDVSIDQGGCIETSQITTLDHPTFLKHGVLHYGVPNIASQVSRTASMAISNILSPLLLKIYQTHTIEQLMSMHDGIKNGCYTYKGCLTNEYMAKRFERKYTNLNLILTSGV